MMHYVQSRYLWEGSHGRVDKREHETEIEVELNSACFTKFSVDRLGFFIAVTDGLVEVLLHPESSETHLWVGVPALSDDLGHRPEHLHQRSRGQRRPFELYTASAGTVCASACIKHVWRSDIHPIIWI